MGETTSRLDFWSVFKFRIILTMGRSGSREQWEDLYRKMWRPAESSEVAGHQGLHVSVLQKRLWELNWSIRWVQVSVTFQKVNLQSPIIMNRLSGWICTDLQVELYAQLWALYFQEDAGPLEKVWKIALGTSSDSIIQPSREDWRNHSDLADQTEGSCSETGVFKYVKCSCTKGE